MRRQIKTRLPALHLDVCKEKVLHLTCVDYIQDVNVLWQCRGEQNVVGNNLFSIENVIENLGIDLEKSWKSQGKSLR